MEAVSERPRNWTIECDEDLVDLLKDIVNTDIPGSIRNLIKSISVSTQRVKYIDWNCLFKRVILFTTISRPTKIVII